MHFLMILEPEVQNQGYGQGFTPSVGSRTAVPNLLSPRNQFHRRQLFPRTGVGDGFRMTLARLLCMLFTLLLYQLHSDHQALDPGSWGPLF